VFKTGTPRRQPLQKHSGSLARVAKLIALLLLGAACTASGVLFILSLGIAIPVLTEQFKSWQVTGLWGDVPPATILSRIGFTSHPEGLVGLMADFLLSWGPSFLILTTAGLFGVAVWIFEAARSRLTIDAGNGAE
jgi:hypothetical protein